MTQVNPAALQTSEVAKLLKLSTGTVRRAVGAGRLRSWHTPGGHLRYRLEDVADFGRELGRLVGQS